MLLISRAWLKDILKNYNGFLSSVRQKLPKYTNNKQHKNFFKKVITKYLVSEGLNKNKNVDFNG